METTMKNDKTDNTAYADYVSDCDNKDIAYVTDTSINREKFLQILAENKKSLEELKID